MISRVGIVVSLALLSSTFVSAQTYDPVAEQLGFQGFYAGSCSGGASDESSRCTWLAIADADGSHSIALPQNGTYGRPGWSPDGRSLVSVRENSIFITSAVGAPETVLTDGSASDQDPAWSPDGSKIAFASDRGGTLDLYVMNPDGSGVTHIATGMAASWGPAWSPDGHRLAFDCLPTLDQFGHVCAINVDGSGFIQLTNHPAGEADPVWSRDGTRIYFATRRFGGFVSDTDVPRIEIASMNSLDGSDVIEVSPGTHAFAPSLSMDGTRIAFQTFDPYSDLGYGPAPEIGVMNADGTGATVVADGSDPIWRPMTGVGTNNRPVAWFTTSCTNGVCTLDGTASSDSDGTVSQYGWSFGDGTTGYGATPQHTYVVGARYAATIIVMDNQGALDTTYQIVDVNQPPVASFTYQCNAMTCTFDGSASYDPDGSIGYWSWEFGDQRGGSGTTATHTYTTGGTYVVRLTVYDFGGKTTAQYQTITIASNNAAPIASFTSACNALTCNFDGSSSTDSDGSVIAWAWNFGDGTTGSGVAASHAYTAAGTYNVTLTVTDNGNATGTTARTVTVTQPEMHVGDLDGAGDRVGATWKATVTITVHDASHNFVSGVLVSGGWSTGANTTCTTNAAGQCSISIAAIPNKTQTVRMSVGGLTRAGYVWRFTLNHDPDGDSNGSVIDVRRP